MSSNGLNRNFCFELGRAIYFNSIQRCGISIRAKFSVEICVLAIEMLSCAQNTFHTNNNGHSGAYSTGVMEGILKLVFSHRYIRVYSGLR